MSTTPRYPVPFREILARIEAKTFKIEGGCHLWQGSMRDSLPYLCIQRHYFSIRKILYESLQGPLQKGQIVRATCAVERCIKPEHMRRYAGVTFATRAPHVYPFRPKYSDALVRRIFDEYRQGNTCQELSTQYGPSPRTILDWVTGKKRRQATGLFSHLPRFITKHHRAKGEAHGNSRLNWAMVLVIHGLLRAGYRNALIARDFSISTATVSSIHYGTTWRWLTKDLPRPPAPDPDDLAQQDALVRQHWEGGS